MSGAEDELAGCLRIRETAGGRSRALAGPLKHPVVRAEASEVRIAGIAASFPRQVVKNADVIERIRHESEAHFGGDLEKTLRLLRLLLVRGGARERYWPEDGERPLDFIRDAAIRSLQQAEMDPADIDLLIYAGVSKGFQEPAQAPFVAQALGMERAAAFDVLEACMGWTRSVLIAKSLIESGVHRNVLVVASEFPMLKGARFYPELYRLTSGEPLQWTFPVFTLGCGATATVLTAEENDPWIFRFTSRSDHADLCTIPNVGFEGWTPPSARLGRNGVERFTSWAGGLFAVGRVHMAELLSEVAPLLDGVEWMFPHAASHTVWEELCESTGLPQRVWPTYTRFGNLASASVPAGLATAMAEGDIQRGDRVLAAVASAGMSFACAIFTF